MKSIKLFFAIAIFAFVFTACEQETEIQYQTSDTTTVTTIVDFEDVMLSSGSVSTGTSFISGNCNFTGDASQFWNGGIVCSSKSDTLTAGYINQYSCIAGTGALSSSNFAILYSPGSFTCPANENGADTIKSIMVTNSTYAYLDMKNGSDYSKKFSTGDWFKLTIEGYKSKVETAVVDVYLADFRDGKTFLMKNWQEVDLSKLGRVDSVAFILSSSDNGDYGMNTPAYACIDNIKFTQTISTK